MERSPTRGGSREGTGTSAGVATRQQRGRSLPRVVGRELERRRIEAFVGAVGSSAPSLVIVGEPGIGKSTLWSYGVARAREVGARVLITRPTEDEYRYPAAGLIDLFDRIDAADAARVAPALDVLTAPDTPPPDRGRRAVQVLRELSRTGPVLLAVDDLQWLDEVSAKALRFALNRLTDAAVALLATSRLPESGPALPPGSARDTEVLEVGPMPIPALRRVLSGSVSAITASELLRAHEVTNGNPMLALELVGSWQRGGPGAAGLAPFHALAEHVRDVSDDAAAACRALALAGPSATSVIERVSAVADFDGAVRDAVNAGVVRVEDDFTMRFTHSLYSDAVLATITALDSRVIHARLATTVTDPSVQARHLALATVEPDDSVARRIASAADAWAKRGAFDIAAQLAGHSVRLTPSGDDDLTASRALREVSYRAASGDTARALARSEQLSATLRPGQMRAEALTLRVFLHSADSERFLTEALDQPGADDMLRAHALDLLGWQVGFYKGRLADGVAYSTAAIDIAQQLDDGAQIVMTAEANLATCLALMGRPREDVIDHAMVLDRACAAPPLGRWPPVFRARLYLWAGDLAAARRLFDQMRRRAITLGSEFQRPYRLYELALVEIAAGDLDSALRLADEAAEAARDAGNEQAVAWVAYAVGMAGALQGAKDRVRWAAEVITAWHAATDETPRLVMADEVLGTLAATNGDWTIALFHFEHALGVLDEMGYAHPGARPALPLAIEAAAMVGDEQRCARFTARLAEQAAALGAPWVDAQFDAARGQLALLRNDLDGAARDLGAAAAELDRLGFRLDAARVRLVLARALLRAGQRSAARGYAEQSRAAFAAASAPQWVAAADELARRGGARPSGEGLTETEASIVALVADGRTNRDISGALFIAVPTVEAHLTRIYRKLELSGRTALTRWFHEAT